MSLISCRFCRFCRLLTFACLCCAASVIRAQPEIAIDVGHGALDGGAVSARGRDEFSFNQDLARQLAERVQNLGLMVRPINFDGSIDDLHARPKLAAGSDFFISIHHDSVSEAYLLPWEWEGVERTHTEAKRGFGLFVSANNPDLAVSLRCASSMGALLRRAGFTPTDWHGRRHLPADAENGVWYYDNLVVLYRTTLPAVLFEAGVIKHKEEELELRDPARQLRMADALASGLAACLQVNQALRGTPAPE